MSMKAKTAIYLSLVTVFSCGVIAYAQAISVSATVSQKQVPLNGRVELRIRVDGSQAAEAPAVSIDGMRVHYRGPSTQIQMINGSMSQSVTHSYVLQPEREGVIDVPAFSVQAGGDTYATQPFQIEVLPAAAVTAGRSGGALQLDQESLERAVQFEIIAEEAGREVYVNETIPVTLRLLLADIPMQLTQMPQLEADGLRVAQIGEPMQSQTVIDGQTFRVVDFEVKVVPIRSGELTLGPANLEAQIVVPNSRRSRSRSAFFEDFFGDSLFDDFFGRSQVYPVSITAAPVTLSVKSLPVQGRPASFRGAVGNFQLDRQASPLEVSVGEPVTVNWIVTGKGNPETVKPPVVDPTDGWKVYEAQSIAGSDSGRIVFEQVFIPTKATVSSLPEARLGYFDPQRGQFEESVAAPLLVKVNPAKNNSVSPIISEPIEDSATLPKEDLGRDIVHIKNGMGKLQSPGTKWYQQPLYWIAWLVALALFGIHAVWIRRKRQVEADPHLLKAGRAMKAARSRLTEAKALLSGEDPAAFYTHLQKTLQQYVGDRFRLSSEGLTAGEVRKELPVCGIDPELANQVGELFELCDHARFARQFGSTAEMNAILERTGRSIEALEKSRAAL